MTTPTPRRPHRTLDREAQRAAGARVRHRGGTSGAGVVSDYSGPAARRQDAVRPGAAPQGERRASHAAGHFAGGSPSRYDDVSRYRKMRQGREDRAVRMAAQAREALGSVGGSVASRIRPSLILKVCGGVIAVALVAILVFAFGVSSKLNAGLDANVRGSLSATLPGQPFYMLLVGTDKSAEREETNATGGTYRTDSIILARVDPIAAKLTLVSIQRDTLVDLGEYGNQKINASYTLGGAKLLVDAVSDLAGVPISHYAEIDFDSFTSVVDTLGGVDVNVPIDLDDDLADLHVKAGEQTIDGATALALCRARHAYDAYGAGDYYRTANQRMVLGAILRKALSGNPASLLATIDAVSSSVTTDLSGLDFVLLATRFLGFNMDRDLSSGLEPTKSSYVDGTWYELLDTQAWQTMMRRVDQGLSPYESEADNPTAGLAG